MTPCRICGYSRGGAPKGERYCSKCAQSLSLNDATRSLTPKQPRPKKMKRTDEGVFSRWSLRYWVSA